MKTPKTRGEAILLLLIAPFIGAAFVVFLPAVGFYLVGRELLHKIPSRVSKFCQHLDE